MDGKLNLARCPTPTTNTVYKCVDAAGATPSKLYTRKGDARLIVLWANYTNKSTSVAASRFNYSPGGEETPGDGVWNIDRATAGDTIV